MSDLFSSNASSTPESYDASAIEVLEGLEPVRRRPGMYIGGTDDRALHHLAAEVIDNSMDEAVAGFANRIEVTLDTGNRLSVSDNGRTASATAPAAPSGTGVGLANVRRRLEVIYGARGRLETIAHADGFTAIVRVPVAEAPSLGLVA